MICQAINYSLANPYILTLKFEYFPISLHRTIIEINTVQTGHDHSALLAYFSVIIYILLLGQFNFFKEKPV